jgi:hypothetical protein
MLVRVSIRYGAMLSVHIPGIKTNKQPTTIFSCFRYSLLHDTKLTIPALFIRYSRAGSSDGSSKRCFRKKTEIRVSVPCFLLPSRRRSPVAHVSTPRSPPAASCAPRRCPSRGCCRGGDILGFASLLMSGGRPFVPTLHRNLGFELITLDQWILAVA